MSQFQIAHYFRRFHDDDAGNVAIVFSLCVLPMLLLVGAGIDYSRSLDVRAKLQAASDSVALALVNQPRNTPHARLQAIADREFAAMTEPLHDLGPAVAISTAGQSVNVKASATMPTTFMKLVRQDSVVVGAAATAVWAKSKIQLALVLDNTGSMGQLGKMAALKAAGNDLIDKLKRINAAPGDIKASVVPFNTQVRVATSYASATWLRWGARLENPNIGAAMATAPTQAAWRGCLSDRDQNYDISGERPIGGTSNYVAANCQYAPLAQMAPLTTDLESVRATLNSMSPAGATNVTIGLATGLATLRADSPFGDASSNDPEAQKFLILLTDGNNTQNRWGGNGSEGNSYVPDIDERLRQACALARSQDVQIFTIRVIAGNEPLLRGCATNPSMYFPATTAADIAPAFAEIIDRISRPRLSM